MEAIRLNGALVACREAYKGFDMSESKLKEIEKIQQRLNHLAVLGNPKHNDVQSCIDALSRLDIIVCPCDPENGAPNQIEAHEDLDFEFMKLREVRKQIRATNK